jgi:hypothetical protein
MALTCNLDSRGKALRLILGIIFVFDGLILLLLRALRTGSTIAWIASIAMILAGAFMIFEGKKGWCVMRAMGFKTPI